MFEEWGQADLGGEIVEAKIAGIAVGRDHFRLRPGRAGELKREGIVLGLIGMQGQADLLEVVRALGAAGRFAGGLDGGQEQAGQDREDRDHDQDFDEGEAGSMRAKSSHRVAPIDLGEVSTSCPRPAR